MYHRWSAPISFHAMCSSGKLTSDPESSEISQILPVYIPSTEDVKNIVYDGRCMAFSGVGDVSDTRQFGPLSGGDIERPGVVVVVAPVRTTKQIKLSLMRYQCMTGSLWRRGIVVLYLFPAVHIARYCPSAWAEVY